MLTDDGMTEVTAAIIHSGGRVLICRRPEEKLCGGLWEFPGGKVERGEGLEECVIRECREELNVKIRVLGKRADTVYAYPHLTVHLHFFDCIIEQGEIFDTEHSAVKWISRDEIKEYEFCPADKAVIGSISFEPL